MSCDEFMTRKEAAAFLRVTYGMRVTANSLATRACRGGGPPFSKMGRYVVYRKIDLIEWAKLQCPGMFENTSTLPSERPRDAFLNEVDQGELIDIPEEFRTGDEHFDEITYLLEEGVKKYERWLIS